MFEKKTLVTLLAASAMAVACGGGGGRDDSTPGSTVGSVNTGTPSSGGGSQPPASNNPPADPGTSDPNAGNPPATPTQPVPPVAVDQKLSGTVDVVANQILYIRTNRIIYLPVVLSQFENEEGVDKGIFDIASGSTVAHYPNLAAEADAENCNIPVDGTCGVQPPAIAPAAPIAAFGIRLGKFVVPTTPGQVVGNQTVVGRIAFDLTERSRPGIGRNEVPEIMRFIIDKVEFATAANGEITSVRVLNDAQIHVYGRNAAGVEVRESIPAPVGTVRMLPLNEVPDHNGDPTSFILLMDLETGFSRAGQKLAALENISGHFSMNVTLSSVDRLLRLPAGAGASRFPPVTEKELNGQTVTVNDQPPVSGAGISGSAWIRMWPH